MPSSCFALAVTVLLLIGVLITRSSSGDAVSGATALLHATEVSGTLLCRCPQQYYVTEVFLDGNRSPTANISCGTHAQSLNSSTQASQPECLDRGETLAEESCGEGHFVSGLVTDMESVNDTDHVVVCSGCPSGYSCGKPPYLPTCTVDMDQYHCSCNDPPHIFGQPGDFVICGMSLQKSSTQHLPSVSCCPLPKRNTTEARIENTTVAKIENTTVAKINTTIEAKIAELAKKSELVQEHGTEYAANLTQELLLALPVGPQPVSETMLTNIVKVFRATANANEKDRDHYMKVADRSGEIISWMMDHLTANALHSEQSQRLVDAIEVIGQKVPTVPNHSSVESLPVWVKATKRFSQMAVDLSLKLLKDGKRLLLNVKESNSSENMYLLPKVDIRFVSPVSLSTLVSVPEDLFKPLNCPGCVHRCHMNVYSKGTFFNDPSLFDKVSNQTVRSLDSWVVGYEVNSQDRKKSSSSPIIELAFPVFTSASMMPDRSSHVCVFWDNNRNDGLGGWSEEGCSLVTIHDGNTIICECSHLTNFAVLLAKDVKKNTSLSTVSIGALALSIIGLLCTLLVHIVIRKLRDGVQSRIIIGLCINILALDFIVIFGAEKTGTRVDADCRAAAVLMHYFFLSSFGWMTVEAVHLHFRILKVFNCDTPRFIFKAILLAQGIPGVFVGLTAATSVEKFGDDDYCRLQVSLAFYLGLVVPMVMAMLVCFITFIRVQYEIQRLQSLDAAMLGLTLAWSKRLKASASLATLFGLSWSCGLLVLIDSHAAIQWLFIILVSTHGVSIFIFQVVCEKIFRKTVDGLLRTSSCGKRFFNRLSTKKRKINRVRQLKRVRLNTAFQSMTSLFNSLFFPPDSERQDSTAVDRSVQLNAVSPTANRLSPAIPPVLPEHSLEETNLVSPVCGKIGSGTVLPKMSRRLDSNACS